MMTEIEDSQLDALLMEFEPIDQTWQIWRKKVDIALAPMPPSQNVVEAISRKFVKSCRWWDMLGARPDPLPVEYFQHLCRLYAFGTENQRAKIRSAFQNKPGGLYYLHWFYLDQIETFRQQQNIGSLCFALLGIAIENTTPDDYYDGPELLETAIYTTQHLTTDIEILFDEIISISDSVAAKWLSAVIKPDRSAEIIKHE